jgi:hypothetical protein
MAAELPPRDNRPPRNPDESISAVDDANDANDDDVFAAVDWSNFPQRDGLPETWRQLGLGPTEDWEPPRWGLWATGKKCKAIYVTVVEFFTFMSSGH